MAFMFGDLKCRAAQASYTTWAAKEFGIWSESMNKEKYGKPFGEVPLETVAKFQGLDITLGLPTGVKFNEWLKMPSSKDSEERAI
jgi:hypothetical protein